MRSSGLTAFASLIVVSCFAQQPGRTGYTGFGATGFAAPPGALIAARQGGGHSHGNGGYSGGYARRTVIAPVYVAVPLYGGYGSGYAYGSDYTDTAPDQAVADQSAPSVIINQNFVPDHASPVVRDVPETDSAGQGGVESFQAPGPPPVEPSGMAEAPSPDQPIIYLIALHDHSIMPALAYWTEGNMLKYVNMDHGINQVSLDLVDRDMSRLLNEQRNVEFRLPGR